MIQLPKIRVIAMHGEALAIKEALLQAASQNLQHICIHTASQVLV